MKTAPQSLGDLLNKDCDYRIPDFQRPYKWTKEEQWKPLWDDVERVCEGVLAGVQGTSVQDSHFLGAVVTQSFTKEHQLAPPPAEVIDGQQRLATLTILLRAAQHALEAIGAPQSGVLEGLIENKEVFVKHDEKFRYKLSLKPEDQPKFLDAMSGHVSGVEADRGVEGAYSFFRTCVEGWLNAQGTEQQARRCEALLATLNDKLILITIETDSGEDANLIFETLNARGTPLLAWDMVRNAMVSQLPNNSTIDLNGFDDEWWQAEMGRGRNRPSRVDDYLMTWLRMRRAKWDVGTKTREIYNTYRDYVKSSDGAVGALADDLVQVSEAYRTMHELEDGSPLGTFLQRWRVVPAGGFEPIVLWLIAEIDDSDPVAAAQREDALRVIESYFVRRMLTGQATRGGGQDLVRLAEELMANLAVWEPDNVGHNVATYFHSIGQQGGQSRLAFESDAALREALVEMFPMYKRLNSRQTRMVLSAIEAQMRDDSSGQALPSNLTIEHLMPQSWSAANYPHPELGSEIAKSEEAQQRRRHLVDSIGNLTLVSRKLNSALSNGPFDKKRSKLNEYSVMLMNKDIEKKRRWSEDDIVRRSRAMAKLCTQIWPMPQSGH